MCRDPRDPHLVLLENGAVDVVGTDWPSRLDKIFVENLGKFRKYDGRSVQDLLRALRNKVRSFLLSYGHESLRFLTTTSRSYFIRNTTTRTYLRTSSATSVPCRKDICRILHAATLASSSTCTLSSPTLLSVKSPCFAHTSILLISLLTSPTIYCLFFCITKNQCSSVSLFRPFATMVVS